MEVIIQIVLMFFFIQFLVVASIMVISLLVAQGMAQSAGPDYRGGPLRRGWEYSRNLPGRALHSVARRVHALYLHGVR